METIAAPRGRRHGRRADGDRGAVRAAKAGLSRRSRAPGQHRLRQLHAGRRRRSSDVRGTVPRRSRGRRRPPPRSGRPARADDRRNRSRAAGAGPRVLLIGHMDTVFDPGTASDRPFRIDGRNRVRTGRHRHEVRSAYRALRPPTIVELTRAGGLPFEQIVFVANPDEEIGSPSSSPYIRNLRRRPMHASSSNAPGRTATSCRPGRERSTSS